MSTIQSEPAAAPATGSERSERIISLSYLKAFVIVLVVAHHASLAYHPAAPPIPTSLLDQPRVWQTYPIVDSHHATWAAVFATFNDVFFMALMFFCFRAVCAEEFRAERNRRISARSVLETRVTVYSRSPDSCAASLLPDISSDAGAQGLLGFSAAMGRPWVVVRRAGVVLLGSAGIRSDCNVVPEKFSGQIREAQSTDRQSRGPTDEALRNSRREHRRGLRAGRTSGGTIQLGGGGGHLVSR